MKFGFCIVINRSIVPISYWYAWMITLTYFSIFFHLFFFCCLEFRLVGCRCLSYFTRIDNCHILMASPPQRLRSSPGKAFNLGHLCSFLMPCMCTFALLHNTLLLLLYHSGYTEREVERCIWNVRVCWQSGCQRLQSHFFIAFLKKPQDDKRDGKKGCVSRIFLRSKVRMRFFWYTDPGPSNRSSVIKCLLRRSSDNRPSSKPKIILINRLFPNC